MPIGWDAKLYRGTAGTPAATLMTNVRDVKLPLNITEADISTRASRFERIDVSLFAASIDFDMLWDETDTDFQVIWAAFIAGTSITMKALGIASGSGIQGTFKVVKCEAAQDLKGAQIANVSVKPTVGTVVPAFATYTPGP